MREFHEGVNPEYLHKNKFMLVVWFVSFLHVLQSVRDVRPRAHVQLFGNPSQRHCSLGPQRLRGPNLARITFRPSRQLCSRPAQFVQFFAQDTLSPLLGRLTPCFGMMTFARAGGCFGIEKPGLSRQIHIDDGFEPASCSPLP